MAFDYPVNLDLAGRRTVVLGGGPLAAERIGGLLASGAEVLVVTPAPGDQVRTRADAGQIELRERDAGSGDLDGAFLAIHTREDGTVDVPGLWAHAEAHGVLFAALDDVEHCHFGAMSTVRRGDLRITVSTAGRAPALAKRLRRELEETYDDVYGELVEVLDEARRHALPREIPFEVWAARWEAALEDLPALVADLRAGERDAVISRVRDAVRGPIA